MGIVRNLETLLAEPLELDAPVRDADGVVDGPLADKLLPPAPPVQFEGVEHVERLAAVRGLLAWVPLRERVVVALRCGLVDGEEHALEEIGELFELSRERVRQVEARALARLRAESRVLSAGAPSGTVPLPLRLPIPLSTALVSCAVASRLTVCGWALAALGYAASRQAAGRWTPRRPRKPK